MSPGKALQEKEAEGEGRRVRSKPKNRERSKKLNRVGGGSGARRGDLREDKEEGWRGRGGKMRREQLEGESDVSDGCEEWKEGRRRTEKKGK